MSERPTNVICHDDPRPWKGDDDWLAKWAQERGVPYGPRTADRLYPRYWGFRPMVG